MNVKLIIVAGFMILLYTINTSAQGFAGLGGGGEGFKKVTSDTPINFLQDFGKHPGYRIEWWYITANLAAEDSTQYGVQWTLFRQAGTSKPLADAWSSGEFWMGHAAITTKDQHLYYEKLARGSVGQADVKLAPFNAWIDDWYFIQTPQNYEIKAQGNDFKYKLSLKETGPKVLHGQNGYSVKSTQGQASYYFSQPFFDASGTLVIDGKETKVSGKAWLDREWSSQPLAANQKGWDWFSLKFDDGTRAMLFQLRETNNNAYYSGSWIEADGTINPIETTDIKIIPLDTSEVDGKKIPTEWQIEILSKQTTITVTALNKQSWMATSVPYWEGPIIIEGTRKGVGYLEMTGY